MWVAVNYVTQAFLAVQFRKSMEDDERKNMGSPPEIRPLKNLATDFIT